MRRAVKIPIGKSPKTYAPRSKFPKDIIPVNKIPAEDASRGDKILPAKAIMWLCWVVSDSNLILIRLESEHIIHFS